MSSLALLNALSSILAGFFDHRRSLCIVIDRALAVVRRGLTQSNTSRQAIRYPLVYIPPTPPPPPPPTRTIPWDIPGTPTIPSGDYQAPFALWVISSLTALATFAVVLSFLARFGARRRLVKIADGSLACLYTIFAVLVLVPFVLLVRGAAYLQRSIRLLLQLSTTALALSLRQVHIALYLLLVFVDNAKVHLLLGIRKATANVSSGNKHVVAPLVLLIAIGLEVVDSLQDVIHKYRHTARVSEAALETKPAVPPDLHFDDPPARHRPTIVEAQEFEPAPNLKTSSYATAPERPSFDNPDADLAPEADPPEAAPDEDTFWGRERRKAENISGLLSHVDPALLRVKDQLGSGAFGDVIKVEDKSTGGVYAIKRIDRAQHPETESSVVREVGCHLRMADNAVVPVVRGFFEDTTSLYVIMDCGRRCFSSLITSLTVESARFFAAQLVLGMQAIHQRGILHRDLKSSNLILGADGHLQIIDFGIARTFDEPDTKEFPAWHDLKNQGTDAFPMLWVGKDNPHSSRRWCGTKAYMCAQIQMGTEYSYNADIWSFGVVLYEWLAAGEVPDFYFDDFEEDRPEVQWSPVPKSVLNDSAMLSFLKKLFSIHCRERFEDYAELKAHPMWGPQHDWKAHMERRLPPPDLNA